jgi:DNA protecting protein DprA
MNVATVRRPHESQGQNRARYAAPLNVRVRELRDLIAWSGRGTIADAQLTLLAGRRDDQNVEVFLAGDVELLRAPGVSIVGTREVSEEGWKRASRLARELAEAGIVVTSGLAKGVDTAALTAAIEAAGRVVAVIGTPLDRVYPAENAALQERIYRDHLLVSPFPFGEQVYPSNFPKRNRVMAALSDASVIVEASDTSGTLHQAAECQRLGRWLFIMRAVAEDSRLKWPSKFVGKPKVAVLSSTSEILRAIRRS